MHTSGTNLNGPASERNFSRRLTGRWIRYERCQSCTLSRIGTRAGPCSFGFPIHYSIDSSTSK